MNHHLQAFAERMLEREIKGEIPEGYAHLAIDALACSYALAEEAQEALMECVSQLVAH